MAEPAVQRFLVCVNNRGYAVSLEKRKIHVALPDSEADKHGQVRVIDESGEEYLYPQSMFIEISLPVAVQRAVTKAA